MVAVRLTHLRVKDPTRKKSPSRLIPKRVSVDLEDRTQPKKLCLKVRGHTSGCSRRYNSGTGRLIGVCAGENPANHQTTAGRQASA